MNRHSGWILIAVVLAATTAQGRSAPGTSTHVAPPAGATDGTRVATYAPTGARG